MARKYVAYYEKINTGLAEPANLPQTRADFLA
jgi:hypothetical protein